MSNEAANRTLDDWIKRCNTFGEVAPLAAKELAGEIPAFVEKAINNQESLSGKKWKPTKDGRKALKAMAKHVTAKAVDTAVKITLTGVEVWHHFGTKRTPQRALWDQGGLSGIKIGNAIRLGLLKVSKEWLERSGSHRESKAFAGGKAGNPSVDA